MSRLFNLHSRSSLRRSQPNVGVARLSLFKRFLKAKPAISIALLLTSIGSVTMNPSHVQAADLSEGYPGAINYYCKTPGEAFWAPGSDVVRGTTVYMAGNGIIPGTRINFDFIDQAGNVVHRHRTQPARKNCVVHHEPEAINTTIFQPGQYRIVASFWSTSQGRYYLGQPPYWPTPVLNVPAGAALTVR